MKNTPLILSVIALVAVAVFGIISLTGNKSAVSGEAGSEGAAATAEKGAIVYFNLDRVLQILDGFGQFLDALLEVGNVLHLVFQSAEAGIIVPAQDQCHGDQQDDDGKLNFYHTAASL